MLHFGPFGLSPAASPICTSTTMWRCEASVGAQSIEQKVEQQCVFVREVPYLDRKSVV